MSTRDRTHRRRRSAVDESPRGTPRLGWGTIGAACILIVALAVGWQWLGRPQPDASLGPPASSATPAPWAGGETAAGNPALLYATHMQEGERAASRGDFSRAAKCYQRALKYAEPKEEAQRELLAALIGVSVRESPEAASQLAAELLRERPEDPALLMTFSDAASLLGNVYGEEGMEGALKRLDRALESESFDAATRKYIVTSAWLDAGRPDLARVEIERAVEASPDNAGLRLMACQLAWSLEDWDACVKHAEKLERLSPDTPDTLWYRAVAFERTGKAEQAKAIYQQLAAKHPDAPLGYVGMSRMLESARDYGGALRWIRLWLDRSPLEPGAAQILVRLLALKGESQEAVKWAEGMLNSPPSPARETAVQKATPPTPAPGPAGTESTNERPAPVINRPLAVTLGTATGFLDAGDYDRAESWAKRAQALAKELPEADRVAGLTSSQLILGQSYWARSRSASSPSVRRENVEKAIDAYRLVLETTSSHKVATNNLALLLNDRGDVEAALFVAERLARGDFSDKRVSGDRIPLEFLDTLGTIYRSAGRFDEAIVLFKEATTRYAKEPQVRLHLGRAHAGRRQYAAAAEQLNLAATLAEEKARSAADPADKAKYQGLAAEARRGLKELPGKS